MNSILVYFHNSSLLYKKFKKINVNDFRILLKHSVFQYYKVLLAGIVFCWLYTDAVAYIQSWVAEHFNNTLEPVCKVILDYSSVNWCLTFALIWATARLCWNLWQNVYYSVSQLIFGCCFLFLLHYNNGWNFVDTPLRGVSYSMLLTAVISIVLIVDVAKLIRQKVKKWNRLSYEGRKTGYTTDKLANLGEETVRRQYAQSVMAQLLCTGIDDNSYALAITGEWGSGKSTFLKYMRGDESKETNIHFMQFNPWDCLSSQALITQFFEQLNNEVSKLYSPIEKSMMKYAKLLTKVDISSSVNKWMELIPQMEVETLSELKEMVRNGLRHIDHPVVIMVDDVDRLDKDELFEVFRLIRNTANFTNLIYIVAYDERYVIEQLSNMGIYSGRSFLEKIFPTQIALPKMDESEIYDEFIADVRQMVTKTRTINSCLDLLSDTQRNFIKRGLPSFRKAKHFARQFSASANFLLGTLGEKGFWMPDLLMMELIRYLSPELYDGFTNHSNDVLTAKIPTNDGETRFQYIVKDNTAETLYKWSKKLDNDTLELVVNIVKDLFKEGKRLKGMQVQWVDKYPNYLCFGIPQDKVSDLEFAAMLKMSVSPLATGGMKVIIWTWCHAKKRKNEQSIYHQFASFNLKNNAIDDQETYIHALLYWLRATSENNQLMFQFLKNQLNRKNFSMDSYERLRHVVNRHLSDLCEERQYAKIAKCLAMLYEYPHDSKLLISNEQIQGYMKQNISNLLKSKDWDAINLVKNDGNRLNEVIKLSAVSRKNSSGDDMIINHTIEMAMNWFVRKKEKSNHLGEVDVMYKMVIDGTNYHNEEVKKQQDEINLLFGSVSGKALFNRFRIDCFKQVYGIMPL